MDVSGKHDQSNDESGGPLLHHVNIELGAGPEGTPKTIEAGRTSPLCRETISQASLQTKLYYLGAWFTLNLLLTLSNKAILAQANLPWLLTTSHTAITTLGCYALVGFGSLKPKRLSTRESRTLIAFSFLYTLNIAISNVSLAMVSVPFHQVMRSMCPVVTILTQRMLGRRYERATYFSIGLLVVGVALATTGDFSCTAVGACLTLLGVILAAVKTVATNRLMTGSLAIDALDLLLRMSPLATAQCVACAFFSGEVRRAQMAYMEGWISSRFAFALLANGGTALALNIISLQANKAAGALTMNVAGNLKQALTILLGIVVFRVQTGLLNAIGILVTLAGAAWYSKLELEASERE